MGVDGMYKFINKNFPDIYEIISINDIRGNLCIIDGMQHIYSQLIYMRSRDREVITKCGKNISHIHGLINSLTYYLKNGIIPIFIFDGKTPEIKKFKIEERKKKLNDNLSKLRELENKKNDINTYLNSLNEHDDIDKEDYIIYNNPSTELINIEEEFIKMNNIQEEYKKIYKKTIIMKDYYIKDWIEILELLELPCIKASNEADPLCAFLLKNNLNIYGIISDDSDMLIFGAPILMRKSFNQQFNVIKLKKLLDRIEYSLSVEYNRFIKFDLNNFIDFSILLGTDYGNFKLNEYHQDSWDILKYYIDNDKNYQNIISPDQYETFINIKKYYIDQDFSDKYDFLKKNFKWEKPKLMQLKKRLLQLFVDEDYIDKNNEFFDSCYKKIIKGKFKNNENTILNNYNIKKNYFNRNYNKESINNNRSFIYLNLYPEINNNHIINYDVNDKVIIDNNFKSD